MPQEAQPEAEFSTEITTGMSAPPMGMTTSTPQTSAASASAQNSPAVPQPAKASAAISTMRPTKALTARWPVKVTGALCINPCSLAKATTEPVKVTAPMAVEAMISTRLCVASPPSRGMP